MFLKIFPWFSPSVFFSEILFLHLLPLVFPRPKQCKTSRKCLCHTTQFQSTHYVLIARFFKKTCFMCRKGTGSRTEQRPPNKAKNVSWILQKHSTVQKSSGMEVPNFGWSAAAAGLKPLAAARPWLFATNDLQLKASYESSPSCTKGLIVYVSGPGTGETKRWVSCVRWARGVAWHNDFWLNTHSPKLDRWLKLHVLPATLSKKTTSKRICMLLESSQDTVCIRPDHCCYRSRAMRVETDMETWLVRFIYTTPSRRLLERKEPLWIPRSTYGPTVVTIAQGPFVWTGRW